jgi:hypothetical protein
MRYTCFRPSPGRTWCHGVGLDSKVLEPWLWKLEESRTDGRKSRRGLPVMELCNTGSLSPLLFQRNQWVEAVGRRATVTLSIRPPGCPIQHLLDHPQWEISLAASPRRGASRDRGDWTLALQCLPLVPIETPPSRIQKYANILSRHDAEDHMYQASCLAASAPLLWCSARVDDAQD